MDIKKHYKLYKDGKLWCIAAIATASMMTTALAAHAATPSTTATTNITATNNGTNTDGQTAVNPGANQTTNSSQPVSQQSSNENQSVKTPTSNQSTTKNSTQPVDQAAISQPISLAPAPASTNNTAVPQTGKADSFYSANNKLYYYNRQGQLATKYFYQNWGHIYYFGEDGARYTNQWYRNWGHQYYFGGDGALTTGLKSIDGTVYDFDNHGVMQTNHFYQRWGHVYYFGADGKRYTNQWYHNWGHDYYFGSDGARVTNWFASSNLMPNGRGGYTRTNTANVFYFLPQTGIMATNRFYHNWGHNYYFGLNGARYTNQWYYNWGHYYYFGNGGVLTTDGFLTTNLVPNMRGGYTNTNANHVYYFLPRTGIMATNYFYSNWGHLYYFGNNGARFTNQWYHNWGHWYYFGDGGVRATSQLQRIDGHTYYFDGQGIMATNQLRVVNGLHYYFGNNGQAVTGRRTIDGHTYTFDDNGAEIQGHWTHNGDQTGYVDNNGRRVVSTTRNIGGHLYYFDASGNMAKNQFVTTGNNTYYFGSNGQAVIGRQTIDESTYNFSNSGIMTHSQWVNDGNKTYFFKHDGKMAASQTMYIDGRMHYFNGDGTLAKNELATYNNNTYYYDANGEVSRNYFLTQNGKTYYFGSDGTMQRDQFVTDHGHTYYLGTDGARYENQLLFSNNHLYYFGADGQRVANRFETVDGHTYYFGADGQAVTGHQTINGHKYLFDNNGREISAYGVVRNGKLYVYDANDQLLKTLDSGTWENMAYAQNNSAMNNIDGYLSYSGWFRPYGTSQNGKTWYHTTASDWRPYLMYVWPSKDVQAKFIQYFVNKGYTSNQYHLTPSSVASLSGQTSSATLDNDAQNLRYVIEQHIAAQKSTSQLANDINSFMTTIPELSAASELSVVNSKDYTPSIAGTEDDDQLIFVNNDSTNQAIGNTSYADSKYRLMNRTIQNQYGNSSFSPELLVGNDIDNSNPVVQAENLNWEYYLLNYGRINGYNPDGNFDGFRIDAADNMDFDVMDQVAQLVNDMYHTKGNPTNADNHLLYNEGYHTSASGVLDTKGNPELYMDSGLAFTLRDVLGRAHGDIGQLINGGVVNRADDNTEDQATPNWSFVNNHDQRKNAINSIIVADHPGQKDVLQTGYKSEYAKTAFDQYYADQAQTNKQWALENVPSQYAILLSNKDTVPQIYYGDLYKETDQYMQTKGMYYDAITTLLKARHEFVSGGQAMNKVNDHLLTSVRFGKGVNDANSNGTDPLSRTTGMAVIVGNDPSMAAQTITVNMGRAHANQQYRNLIDTTATGLTYNGQGADNAATLTTDANGNLHINVSGFANPYVKGYLSVWVPVISGTQSATTPASAERGNSSKYFQSNTALDSHVIYEDFSLFQPNPTSTANHAYNIIANNAQQFADWGISDFWMAPAYQPFGMSRYNEGYSMTDRYTLGTDSNPTKYGSGRELSNAIAALHRAGLKVQEDLVMNQMIGFSTQEAVTVTRANSYGYQKTVDGKTFANIIYFAYTIGGGAGQQKFGGHFLAQLQRQYPDLFTTKAGSTGVAPDPSTHITQWSAKYQNGTSLQNIGTGLAIKLSNGNYAYINEGNDKSFNTTLPDVISSPDYYADQAAKNN